MKTFKDIHPLTALLFLVAVIYCSMVFTQQYVQGVLWDNKGSAKNEDVIEGLFDIDSVK